MIILTNREYPLIPDPVLYGHGMDGGDTKKEMYRLIHLFEKVGVEGFEPPTLCL